MTRLRWVLLVLGVLGVVAVAAYFYGRQQCPPPDWWSRLFTRGGNFACVVR